MNGSGPPVHATAICRSAADPRPRWRSAPVLVRFHLRFERQQLGERRVRIGFGAASVLRGTPGPRRPVVIAAIPIAARAPITPLLTLAALRTRGAFSLVATLGTVPALLVLLRRRTLLTWLAVAEATLAMIATAVPWTSFI